MFTLPVTAIQPAHYTAAQQEAHVAHIAHVDHLDHLAYLRTLKAEAAERAAQAATPVGGSYTQWEPARQNLNPGSGGSASQPSSPTSPTYSSPVSSSGGSDGSLSSIPGVPSSFVKCVAYRESTDGTNAAYNGGDYGIITASGINVNGQSLSAQKAAFKQIYDTTGPSAWSADHCPGT